MLKLLIADDEKKVCQLIEYIVDWNALGVEIVGIVNDGGDAYREILSKKPDIVITDIRMPTYDGLELIQMTKEVLPETAFIVISGYSQFEYAQSALRYGVVNYLLKPIKKRELEESVQKIMEAYASKRDSENRQKQIEMNLESITRNSKKMLLHNLLFHPNEDLNVKTVEQINENYSCGFREGAYAVFVIKFFIVQNEDSYGILMDKAKNIFDNRMLFEMYESLSAVRKHEIVYLLNGPDLCRATVEKKLRIVYIELLKLRDIFENLNVVLSASGSGQEFSQIIDLYEQAEYGMLSRYTSKDNILFFAPEDAKLRSQRLVNAVLRNELLSCFERLDLEAMQGHIQDIQEEIIREKLSGREIRRELLDLYACIEYGMKSYMDCVKLMGQDEFEEVLGEAYRISDIFDYLHQILAEKVNQYLEMKREQVSKPIREAQNYIHAHYGEKISLVKVSELVGFNSSYFSVLFKKETGQNFTDYVVQIRMEYAKQMLVRTDMDIYEIASMVGYSDIKYFAKLFKKTVDLSPMEYRKMFG